MRLYWEDGGPSSYFELLGLSSKEGKLTYKTMEFVVAKSILDARLGPKSSTTTLIG